MLRSTWADAIPTCCNRTDGSAITGDDVHNRANGNERAAQRLNDFTVRVLSAVCDHHSLVRECSWGGSIGGVFSADDCNSRRVRSSNGVIFQPD